MALLLPTIRGGEPATPLGAPILGLPARAPDSAEVGPSPVDDKARIFANAGPRRTRKILVTYTEYDWWLTQWTDNSVVCPLSIDHEGLPSVQEIFRLCGSDVGGQWLTSGPCESPSPQASKCSGLYLHLAGTALKQKTVEVDLPRPEVWLSLSGCTPDAGRPCASLPSLVLSAIEPLPNEQIVGVRAAAGEDKWDCGGADCAIPLFSTPSDGLEFNFWAESSLGDTSQIYSARVRAVPDRSNDCRDDCGWFVDIISSQWRSPQPVACSLVWDSLPPPGGPPDWLSTPASAEALASDRPLQLLAGRLIAAGAVDVGDCPSGGMLPEGIPDACGLEKAQPIVDAWQDRFDAQILDAANNTGIPAELLKRVFAQESQFWPGSLGDAQEFGLGRLTDEGADTTLLWNRPFFDDFCPLILDRGLCGRGYAQLNETHRAMLRGALVLQAQSDCPTCGIGVDLTRAGSSIRLFALTLLANCEQVGRMVFNTTHRAPGDVASYEDLWRFTLANYNAGPGCMASALRSSRFQSGLLQWQEVAARLPTACEGGKDYVDRIVHLR